MGISLEEERGTRKYTTMLETSLSILGLKDNGLVFPHGTGQPGDWLYDEAFRNMTTEQVYEKIYQDPPQNNGLGEDVTYTSADGKGEGDPTKAEATRRE